MAKSTRLLLTLPPQVHREAARRAAADGITIQHAIVFTLIDAWGVHPVPEVRTRGKPPKQES